jgi:hypothetical protein
MPQRGPGSGAVRAAITQQLKATTESMFVAGVDEWYMIFLLEGNRED